MGMISTYEKEKLVMGFIYTKQLVLDSVILDLCKIFGPIDLVSQEYSFSSFSKYYNAEMDSDNLNRVFVSFSQLIDPSLLWEIKTTTNEFERLYSIGKNRQVNIDPCLLGHGKFVMASTKNASYRISLSNGIYAELALVYSRGHWISFHWTYGDIKSTIINEYLCNVRERYLIQRKNN